MNYCPGCGHRLFADALFCADCGGSLAPSASPISDVHLGQVRLTTHDRRVHPGALAAALRDPTLAEEWDQDLWVAEDSLEARRARRPFKPTSPPGPADWVPADCAWALIRYPGRLRAMPQGKLENRLRQMGSLAGRPRAEIVRVVGPPNSSAGSADGGQVESWHRIGLLSSYSITLGFDRYGVCKGVISEQAI